MRHSDKTGKLMAALAKAQADLTDPKEASRGHHGTYASLADGLPAARRVLASHGVALLQSVDVANAALVTRLALGDEWLEGDYPLIINDKNPQHQGSAVTYARRYACWSMLALAPEDDDGQRAADSAKHNHRRTVSRQTPRDGEHWPRFVTELGDMGWTVDQLAAFLHWQGSRSMPWDLTAQRRGEMLHKLAEPDEQLQGKITTWMQTQAGKA